MNCSALATVTEIAYAFIFVTKLNFYVISGAFGSASTTGTGLFGQNKPATSLFGGTGSTFGSGLGNTFGTSTFGNTLGGLGTNTGTGLFGSSTANKTTGFNFGTPGTSSFSKKFFLNFEL